MAYAMYVPLDGPVQDLGRVVVPIRRAQIEDDPSRTVLVLALDAHEAVWLSDQATHLALQDPAADRVRTAVLIAS